MVESTPAFHDGVALGWLSWSAQRLTLLTTPKPLVSSFVAQRHRSLLT